MREAAILTGLSLSHLYKLTSTNGIPCYKPTGKAIYFNREELEAWMLRGRKATAEDHLLGLAMTQSHDLHDFYSVTLFPAGNKHFEKVIPYYQSQLTEPSRDKVFGCTYEKYIDAIDGNNDVLRWKAYLQKRYIVQI